MKYSVQTAAIFSRDTPVFDDLTDAISWIQQKVAEGQIAVTDATVWDSFENKRGWRAVVVGTGALDGPRLELSDYSNVVLQEHLESRHGIDVARDQPFFEDDGLFYVSDPTDENPDRCRLVASVDDMLREVVAGWSAEQRRQFGLSAAEMAQLSPFGPGGRHVCDGLPRNAAIAFERIANGLLPRCSKLTIGRLLAHGLIEAVSAGPSDGRTGPAAVEFYTVPFEVHIRWRHFLDDAANNTEGAPKMR